MDGTSCASVALPNKKLNGSFRYQQLNSLGGIVPEQGARNDEKKTGYEKGKLRMSVKWPHGLHNGRNDGYNTADEARGC